MSDGPLSPEEVAHRGFGTAFRGFDTAEVRTYLQRVANDLRASTARERELHRRLADAEHRAAHPVLEGDALTHALGDEMGRILASAQQAANGLKDKAEENAARILREAHEQAQRIRAQAEAILAVRTQEAEAEASEITRGAEAEAAAIVERASQEAAGVMADVEARARQLVHDAQAARARVLGELTRRRRLLQTQVEQLRAGRERLLEAYRKVRSTTDEVADELQRVEDEAREAAGAAGERLSAEPATDDVDTLGAFSDPPGEAGDSTEASPIAGAVAVGGDTVPGDGERGAAVTGTSSAVPGAPGEAAAADPAVAASGLPVRVKAEVAAQLASQEVDAAEGAAEAAEAVAAAERTAAEAGQDESGVRSPEHSSQVVSSRPGAERRPLRLLRRPKAEGPPPERVPVASDDGVVRVLPPQPEPVVEAAAASVPATSAASDGEVVEPTVHAGPSAGGPAPDAAALRPESDVPPGGAGSSRAGGGGVAGAGGEPAAAGGAAAAAAVAGVDELFARIRAGRADAVARANEVLAADAGAPVLQQGTGGSPAPGEPGAAAAPEPGPVDEETLLQRRDSAIEGLEPKLARRLKRALQDEQNEVLDRLRSARAGTARNAVLPAPTEHAARYREAAEELLRASASAGAAFVAPADGPPSVVPDVADVVDDLAAAVAEPLRRALERAVGGDGSDQAAVVERIGAAYRECKAQRIEGLAGDAVTAAFSRGALSTMPPGALSRWMVDDEGRPCPDCDDNTLAGPTPVGDAFPTGQTHPPAHAGCRCLLAPAELATAAPGPGRPTQAPGSP